MKVLFLDVDGVLNSNACRSELSGGGYLDEEKVKLLSRVVRRTGSVVVLHSGWRFWFTEAMEPARREAAGLLALLTKYGVGLYGKTPDFSTPEVKKTKRFSLVKASEILSWLRNHDNVENYLVLNDLDLHSKQLEKHQIRTDSETGFSDEDVSRAIELLGT